MQIALHLTPKAFRSQQWRHRRVVKANETRTIRVSCASRAIAGEHNGGLIEPFDGSLLIHPRPRRLHRQRDRRDWCPFATSVVLRCPWFHYYTSNQRLILISNLIPFSVGVHRQTNFEAIHNCLSKPTDFIRMPYAVNSCLVLRCYWKKHYKSSVTKKIVK